MSQDGMLPKDAPIYLRDFYYSASLTIFSILTFFMSPFLGSLSDIYGRKKLMVWGLIGTAIGSLICVLGIYVNSISILLLGRALSGVTAGTGSIVQAAMIDITEPEKKARNFSIMAVAGSGGFALGPIIGGYFSNPHLVSWFSYWTPFLVDAILAILNALFLSLSFNDSYQYVKKIKLKFNFFQPLQVIKAGLLDDRIKYFVLVNVLFQTAWTLYFQYMGIFLLQKYHLTSTEIGNYMSFLTACLAVTTVFIQHYLLKFFRELQLVILSLFIFAILTPWHILTNSLNMQYFIAIPLMISISLIWNCILTLVSDAVTAEQQGWAMGVMSGAMSFAWIVASILTGLLDYLMPSLPFWCVAVFALFASFILKYRYPKSAKV